MADQILQGKPIKFNTRLFMSQDSSTINLTLKTYKTKRGLATKIHKTSIEQEA